MNERNCQRFASQIALFHLALPQPTPGTAAKSEADGKPGYLARSSRAQHTTSQPSLVASARHSLKSSA